MAYTITDVIRANPLVFQKLMYFTFLMAGLPLFVFYACQGARACTCCWC